MLTCLICSGRNGRQVTVYVTELNDVIKRHHNINHNIVTTIWRTLAIEVTALLKNNLRSEMKGVQKKKELIVGVRGRQKNPSLANTVRHHSASLVMPDSDPRNGIFYLPLTPMIRPYNTLAKHLPRSALSDQSLRYSPGLGDGDRNMYINL